MKWDLDSGNSLSGWDKWCVPYTYVCDGDDDCKNGDDEANCRKLSKLITKIYL